MPTHVRDAISGDLEALGALLAEINNLHAEGLPHVYKRVSAEAETADYLIRIIAPDVLHLHVAEQAGKVVGFVVFQVEQAPETPVHVPRQWVLVSLIVVSRDVRSRGIGTELLRHVQAWVMEYGIPEIELQVAEFNTAAIAWYEGMGFRSRYRHMAWSVDDEADVPGGSGPDTG